MPTTWNNNKCGYCAHQSVEPLTKYVCPKCKRTGCLVCMPTGESTSCGYCKAREKSLGLQRPSQQ